MNTFPAIALIELNNIATGVRVGDAMTKKSPVAVLKTGTVSHGKYLVFVGGTVAAVDEAYREGMSVGGADVLDAIQLPDVHRRVLDAALGTALPITSEALGILETACIATNIEAADRAIKGAAVEILQIRLGEGYGGKGYTFFNGKVEDVEMAVEIADGVAASRNVLHAVTVIPSIHPSMAQQINGQARFSGSQITQLPDGEQDVTG